MGIMRQECREVTPEGELGVTGPEVKVNASVFYAVLTLFYVSSRWLFRCSMLPFYIVVLVVCTGYST